jgi:hypothetical protein
MALRDKLATRSQPLLPDGATIRHVFVGQTGPNPMWLAVTSFILFSVKYRVVAVTDDAIYVMHSSKMKLAPKEIVATLPRSTRIGPMSGLWTRVQLGDERVWINKRFRKDVEAADAATPVR